MVDEAQAWLLARDNSLPDLLGHALRYEGTPGLWHLLLWVAIRCGLAYSGLYLISSALACGGAWLVLYRSPFPAWLRVGVIFSYFFGYRYSVVARSYSLDLLLIPLVAYLYDKRLGRPVLDCLVLGLCVNSNAHSFLIGDVLFADFLWAAVQERRWRESEVMGAMATFCLLAGTAVLQARPAADLAFLPAVHDNFAPERQIPEGVIDSGAVGLLAALVLTVFVLVPIWMLCGWLFAGLLGAVTLFAAVEYANVWHGGMVYLICVLCLWVSWPAAGRMPSWQRNWLMAAVALLLVVQVRETLESWRRELREPYSSGLRAAELLKGSVVVGGMGFKAFSVQPWFARNIFANYYRGAPTPSYYDWRAGQKFAKLPDPDRWREMVRSGRYDALVLSTFNPGKAPAGDDFVAVARESGYCLESLVPGGMIWKGYVLETDDLAVFKRCGR